MFKQLYTFYRQCTIVHKMILFNVLIFAFQSIIQLIFWAIHARDAFQTAIQYFYLPLNLEVFKWRPYSLITYQFMHATDGISHIFFNMLSLFVFAPLFTVFQSEKRILPLYLMSGIFAGLVAIASYSFLPILAEQKQAQYLLGASASVMAILVAATTFSPHFQVSILGVFTIKILYVTLFYVFVFLSSLPFENHGGHISHLAGILFGFIYVKLYQKGYDLLGWLVRWIDSFVAWFDGITEPKTNLKVVHSKGDRDIENETYHYDAQEELNRILDKINRSGFDSLTKTERDFLTSQSHDRK